jgi:hypothetical protein
VVVFRSSSGTALTVIGENEKKPFLSLHMDDAGTTGKLSLIMKETVKNNG